MEKDQSFAFISRSEVWFPMVTQNFFPCPTLVTRQNRSFSIKASGLSNCNLHYFLKLLWNLEDFLTLVINNLISCTNHQDIQYQSFAFMYIAFFFIRVLQNLTQINIINSQKALGDLNSAAHVQQAAIWQIYGKK